MSAYTPKRLGRGQWIPRWINNEPVACVACCALSLLLAVMVIFPYETRDFLLSLLRMTP